MALVRFGWLLGVFVVFVVFVVFFCEDVFIPSVTSKPEKSGSFSPLASCFYMSFKL